MSLLYKILQSKENRSARHKTRRLEQAARRSNEDPGVYQVKHKLKQHPDPKYRNMSEQELAREATLLSQTDSLMEMFSDLTHKPIESIMEEVSLDESNQSALSDVNVQQKHIERASQLTLKLHLKHLDETPSAMTRLGAALLKVPYGVLHATLEIGDTTNPNISYMLEFNDSHLVQPRKKNKLECTALEATIPLGGASINKLNTWPRAPTSAEIRLREKRATVKTGVKSIDEYFSTLPRERSLPIPHRREEMHTRFHSDPTSGATGKPNTFGIFSLPTLSEQDIASLESSEDSTASSEDATSPDNTNTHQQGPVAGMASDNNIPPKTSNTQDSEQLMSGCQTTLSGTEDTTGKEEHSNVKTNKSSAYKPPPLLIGNPLPPVLTSSLATPSSPVHDSVTTSEDLTHLLHLSLSKIMLVEKLVQIIIQYNTSYYYHSITRNCQTFIVDVLRSFGVWENFKLGEKLEVYLKNLNKGKKEVYKSHKAVNDRVKYLVQSGEMEETTCDELRYLRSLYTIFHLEEMEAGQVGEEFVCSERDCMLNVLEAELKKKRPQDTTVLLPPEYYM